MTRQERLQAIADYFAWVDTTPIALSGREANLAAYDQHLELGELRKFKRQVESGGTIVDED